MWWWLACAQPGPHPSKDADDPTIPTDPTDGVPPVVDSGTHHDSATPPTDGTVELGALVFDEALPANLVVISLDTTRHDYLGRYTGNTDTPNLDGFLADSFALDNHRSCSNWTAWSMTCVVSGRNPMENGFAPWAGDSQIPGTPPASYETLARRLTNELDWATTVVTANSVFSSDLGIDEGFAKEVRVDWQPAETVAAAALDEARALASQPRPFYLHVHFIDPHGDYCPPEGYYDLTGIPDVGVGPGEVCYGSYDDLPYFWYEPTAVQDAFVAELEELYRGELRYWDTVFGEFFAQLDAEGVLDDALVVFVTDHGQQFYERGGHGHGIYLGQEENLSTAAFWAHNLHPAAWDGPTLHQDLTATLYEAYGLKPLTPMSGQTVGTADALRVMRAENYWGWGGPVQLSVVQGDHQLVYDWYGSKQFYKLEDDATGLTDVYDPTDPDVIDLWPAMIDWADEVESYWPHLGPPWYEGP